MATRGWASWILLATGAGAAVAAAQLGLGYGLGVLHWTGQAGPTGQAQWLASLSWTVWIAATATVTGAILADRLAGGDRGRPAGHRAAVAGPRAGSALRTAAWRVTIALAAGLGGLLTVPLVAVPARATLRAQTPSAQLVAGGYALLGLGIGVLLAIAALSARAVAANLAATAVWVWTLAVGTAALATVQQRGLSTAPLATWHFSHGPVLYQSVMVWAAMVMLGGALVLGAGAAIRTTRRGQGRVGSAVSGTAGPVLIATAYFLAAPRLSGTGPSDQLSGFLVAPYAVIAGLTGSMLLVALAGRRAVPGLAHPLGLANPQSGGAQTSVASARGIASPVTQAGSRSTGSAGESGVAPVARTI